MSDHKDSNERGKDMRIYDADIELNKLFNLPGLEEDIKDYQRGFRNFTIIDYLPMGLYVAYLFILLVIGEISNENALSYLIFGYLPIILMRMFISAYSEKQKQKIYDANQEIYDVIQSNSDDLNLDYLAFILKQRIQEKKDANQQLKGMMTFFFVGIGFSSFTNQIFYSLTKNVHGQLIVYYLIFLFASVCLMFEVYENFINDSRSLHKWMVLYETVNHLLKLKVTKGKNDKLHKRMLSLTSRHQFTFKRGSEFLK